MITLHYFCVWAVTLSCVLRWCTVKTSQARIIIATPPIDQPPSIEDYWRQRDKLIKTDLQRMAGSNLKLNEIQEELNDYLKDIKNEEYGKSMSSDSFLLASHFFKVKDEIGKSQVFQFIRKMPKGAMLHVHDMSMTSMNWVVSHLTYWNDLYACERGNKLVFRFFTRPNLTECDWRLVKEMRDEYPSKELFDQSLLDRLSLFNKTNFEPFKNSQEIWGRFEEIFVSLSGLLTYKEAWKEYLRHGLRELVEDKVIYVEIRGILAQLYDKNGTVYSVEDTLSTYIEVIDQFTQEEEFFIGARFIYAPKAGLSERDTKDQINIYKRIKAAFPDFVVGFDLVGFEDKKNPLKNMVHHFLKLKQDVPDTKFFFHAGETNWQGTDVDENLFDAYLLNASRIGHGFAVSKHPRLRQLLQEKQIPLEICPISNQVLKLVSDLRNHPAVGLLADSQPAVLSSDDPSIWSALPLSHDFYAALMAFGGKKADLKFLLNFVYNSITFSSLSNELKEKAMKMINNQFKIFYNEYI